MFSVNYLTSVYHLTRVGKHVCLFVWNAINSETKTKTKKKRKNRKITDKCLVFPFLKTIPVKYMIILQS